MVWREELSLGRILLREVIDLEQTYGDQVAQALSDEAVAGEQIEAEPVARDEDDEDGDKPPPGVVNDDGGDFDDRKPVRPSARWKPSCARGSWLPSTPSPVSSRPSAACRRSWSSTACAART